MKSVPVLPKRSTFTRGTDGRIDALAVDLHRLMFQQGRGAWGVLHDDSAAWETGAADDGRPIDHKTLGRRLSSRARYLKKRMNDPYEPRMLYEIRVRSGVIYGRYCGPGNDSDRRQFLSRGTYDPHTGDSTAGKLLAWSGD